MKNRCTLLALALLPFAHPARPGEPEPAFAVRRPAQDDPEPAPAPSVADLGFLAGTWRGDAWGGEFVAYYTTAEGGRVLSHSQLLREGREVYFEFEVFSARDGVVHLQPFPGGQPATGLALARIDRDGREAVFENPDKDYPTRIAYHRVADDRLVITLSDPHGGSDKVERFDLAR